MESCPSGLWCNLGKIVDVKVPEVQILYSPFGSVVQWQNKRFIPSMSVVQFYPLPCVRSIMVNAPDCESGLCEFKSRRTPRPISSVVQSNCLVNNRSSVQIRHWALVIVMQIAQKDANPMGVAGNLLLMSQQPSGKAKVCKTFIRRFDSDLRLCGVFHFNPESSNWQDTIL